MSTQWTPIDQSQTSQAPDPKLTIYGNLEGYINAAADRRWFDDSKRVKIAVAEDDSKVGFQPASADDKSAYELRRETERGATLSLMRSLTRLGLEEDDVDETLHIPLSEQDQFIVADLSDVLSTEDGRDDGGLDESSGTGSETGDDEEAKAESEAAAEQETTEPEDEAEGPGVAISDDDIGELDSERRRDIAAALGDLLSERGLIEADAGDLADALNIDIKTRALAQHLSELRDNAAVPFAVDYCDPGVPTETYLRVIPDGDASDDDAEERNALDLVDRAIDRGYDDVHEIAVHLDIPTTRVRAAARDLDRYGELNDAAEGGGYGRGGD